MESIPDELLLMIFSLLECASTLLDVVPLVCRRWQRLSRDPKAWASARATVQFCDDWDKDCFLAAEARVLLHAPALRELVFTEGFPDLSNESTVEWEDALRRCYTVLHGVAVVGDGDPAFWEMPKDPKGSALAHLIGANCATLQSLRIYPGRALGYLSDESPKELMASVERCVNLRSLACPGNLMTPTMAGNLGSVSDLDVGVWMGLNGPLADSNSSADWLTAGSLPALRSLRFYVYADDAVFPNDVPLKARQMLLPLCRAAPGLTQLWVSCEMKFRRRRSGSCVCRGLPLAEALASLPKLRSLKAHGGASVATALAELPLAALGELDLHLGCSSFSEAADAERAVMVLMARLPPGVKGSAEVFVRGRAFDWDPAQ